MVICLVLPAYNQHAYSPKRLDLIAARGHFQVALHRVRVFCAHVCLQLHPYIQRLVVDFIRSWFDLVGQYQQQTTPCPVIPTCPSAAASAATASGAGCCSRTTGKCQWQSDCARHLKCTTAKRAVCPRSFSRCAHVAFESYEPYLIILQASPPKAG